MHNERLPLAIVGIGCLFPASDNTDEYWSNIRDGVDAISDIPDTHWQTGDYFDADQRTPDMTYARRGGFINPVAFDPLAFGISPNAIEATDTTQLLGMWVARQALLDAGYATSRDSDDGRAFDRDRVSVIMGVTGTLELVLPLGARLYHPLWRQALAAAGVDADTAEQVVKHISDGLVPWQENSFPGLLGNVAAGRIANRFDLGGTNCVVDAACASSLSAIHLAALELANGRADMVISGGLDTFNDIFMYMCFSKTPALSPSGACRPFAKNGDGTLLGEGLGVVILKRLADAERDHDHIYALLKGIGRSSDGRGKAIYAPNPKGQIRALRDAYGEAGVTADSIELVEAHGTGTTVGDAAEVEALTEVYRATGGEDTWCAIGSVKSMIGHTKSAAGVAGVIKAALALKHKVLPPTIKVDEPLASLTSGESPFYVNTIKRPWVSSGTHPRRAAVSAFGFGGSNFHCVLEEAPASKANHKISNGHVLIVAFSANDKTELTQKLASLEAKKSWDTQRSFAARSLASFDATKAHRLLLVVEQKKTHLPTLLASARTQLADDAKTAQQPPTGVYYSGHCKVGKTAVLFPGQGAQYVGMLRDLACQFPEFISALQKANRIQAETTTVRLADRLSDMIYPIPVFSDKAHNEQIAKLCDTRHAQPAIGVISLAAFKLLERFGVTIDVAAGHSYGELVALAAAGIIDSAGLYQLSLLRGQLMAAEGGDQGAMLAVASDATTLTEQMSAAGLDVVIANYNTPLQTVLSGTQDSIRQAANHFKERGIQTKHLKVSAAFHSRFVAGAETHFANHLAPVPFQPGTIPVFSNTTADTYPSSDQAASKALLAGQLARPVRFVEQIEAMYDHGVRTFVEVGPGCRLGSFVKAILDGRPAQIVSLDASSGKRSGINDLAHLLAALAASGQSIKLSHWDTVATPTEATATPSMTIELCGANYVSTASKPPPSTAQTLKKQEIKADETTHLALQKMQQQTADLHRQYLLLQETAQHTIAKLLGHTLPLPKDTVIAATTPAPLAEMPQPVEVSQSAPAPAPTPTLTPAPAVAEKQDEHNEIHDVLLKIVAEKTGYPLEMLSLNMSLDTDLGIDSIKRVEILSALQEQLPELPTIDPDALGTLQSLQSIVEFLLDKNQGAPLPKPTASTAGDDTEPATTPLSEKLLAVVAEKTGYPIDMLTLDMHLETDLGIDSIKRVEILSLLQEQLPELPTIDPDALGTLQSLQSIVEFLLDKNQGAPSPKPTASTADDTKPATTPLSEKLLAVVAEKTGYPVDMLTLDMHLETDLGIDSIKRVEILSALQEQLPDLSLIEADTLGTLTTLAQIVEQLSATTDSPADPHPKEDNEIKVATPKKATAAIERQVLTTEPVKVARLPLDIGDGVIWINDADPTLAALLQAAFRKRKLRAEIVSAKALPNNTPEALVMIAPHQPSADFMQECLELLHGAYDHVRLLVGITQLGGRFGIDGVNNPMGGGVLGLVKTAHKEWQHVACKAIDIDGRSTDAVWADSIVDECLLREPLEVALTQSNSTIERITPMLVEAPLPDTPPTSPLAPGEVIVISGGGRGITANIAVALAREWQAKLVLLGRSAEPAPKEPDWLCDLEAETDIKKALIARHDSPVSIDAITTAYQNVLAAREIRQTLTHIQESGGQAIYCSVDIRDVAAVTAAVSEARKTLGPIGGVVHGAGVLADRLIKDKTIAQFNKVYLTKVEGAASLLTATADDPLKFIAFLSSSTARFGRRGQCDYAAANEVLNKIAQQQAKKREHCRVVSVNWGPWDGGMVDEALKKIFAAEGVGVIPPDAGANHLLQEISNGDSVEVVALGKLSTAHNDSKTLATAFQQTLSVQTHAFLDAHVIGGCAVLPVAVMIEWLAHGAIHNNPSLHFHGFKNFRLLKGVTLDENALDINISAGEPYTKDGIDIVPTELHSADYRHAIADCLLASAQTADPSSKAYRADHTTLPQKATPYYANKQLFHGKLLRGLQAIKTIDNKKIVAHANAADHPQQWMQHPVRSAWLADPLILDSAFQLMIVWCFEQLGKGSLPVAIGEYRQFCRHFPKAGCQIVITVTEQSNARAVADILFIDPNRNKVIAEMTNYECVIDKGLAIAFADNQLASIGG